MNKYTLVEVQGCKEWDEFVETSPQGTIFSTFEYLQNVGRKFKLFYVLHGNKLKAGISLILSDNEKGIEIDELVIYNGLMFIDDKKQKPVSAKFDRFEITEFAINELAKKFDRIEMALSPHFEDARPFLWHNYHSENPKDKFSIVLKYTSYLDISDLTAEGYLEYETPIFKNMERLRQRRIKESRLNNAITINEFDAGLFMTYYTKLLDAQGILVPSSKLQRMKHLIDFLLASKQAKAFSVLNSNKDVIYKTLFCFDSKRAYSLFGAGDLEQSERYKGTMAFWDAFQCLAKENGIKEVDLEGVNSPMRGWFKLSFGGSLVPYFHVLKK